MTIFQFKFDKILSIKEQEKEEVYYNYQNSIHSFEKAAEKLYETLKKKEDLETYQADQLVKGFAVQEIRHFQTFIMNMDKTISYYQDQVMKARNKMKWLEQKFSEKNMEVKQFEKIKENDASAYKLEQQKEENKMLDELSVMKFVNREIR
ncbi:flagellar export protein FliJ [Bacillus sp. 2205SS5-2]|uniref:flagellar export protein FliJ n=1 Tax=Bacillus sp. 2205SS5-2 TaxID=3109031 RepID=UPI003004F972